ncbi:T9SS type A sorting domain-containing protein [uncultured Kordia sp.]|uniref:T9SS type A sorting domain-containing protein n=1 Tax=uncultured Kordia sp. TaxID=507699 RepID=UPI00262F2CC3|nr:T9SS type A sorting domain-containing protein [uncultured Kordia sp.]
MKRKLCLTLTGVLALGFSSLTYGQNWRTSILDENSNYFEIVEQENQVLAPLRNNTDRKSRKKVKQFERWAAFWKDRVLPNGKFMPASYMANLWNTEQEQQRTSDSPETVADVAWSLLGPITPPVSNIGFYPGMGRINAVAFAGNDTNTMYIGTPAGGIWKTTDGGTTWTAQGDEFPNMGISDIAIDPTNTNIVYAATGDVDGFQNRSVGVLKTTDGGNNWAITGLSFTLGQSNIISKVLIDPNNVNTVFATTRNNIKRTTDGGTTWTDVFTENAAIFNDIGYKEGSNTIMYATSRSGRFYVSTDNGTTWTVAARPAFSRLDFATTAANTDLILSIDNFGRIRRSTDQGSMWTLVGNIPGFSSQGGYNVTLAISPINENLVLAGGVDGWRSTDGGATWEKYLDGYWEAGNPYFYVHSDHHDMKFVPGTNMAISVNDGGIFMGDAQLDNAWADLSSGITITQYYNVSGTPQNANLLIAGAQDNDIGQYDGTDWIGRNPGSDGVEGLWDYSNSDIAWTCSQAGTMFRTTNGFASSQFVPTPNGAPFVWELEIHPTVPTTIFGGFGDIYRSVDQGNNWTNLNSGVGTVEFISIAPSDPDVIYVSGSNGVRRTTNGGLFWAPVALPQAGNVKSIEVHPTNPTEVYIAYSGYQAGKVYKSTTSGALWVDITGTLPNIPTHKILYRTGTTDGELFLATDLGVYYRTDSVGDWVRLGQGLPNVIVNDIEIHYATNKLRAATFGRGVWEVAIDEASLSVGETQLPQNAVKVYPNPTIDKKFTISLQNLSGNKNILVYNLIGSVVKEINTTATEEKIDLDGFAKGLYMVKISNDGKSIIKKIVVN